MRNAQVSEVGLRPYEAARLLGITETTLRDMTKRGEVPCWRIGGGTGRRVHVRYSREALLRLCKSHAGPQDGSAE